MRAGAKMYKATYIDFVICQRMICPTIAKITPNDHDLLFKVKNCDVSISETFKVSASM